MRAHWNWRMASNLRILVPVKRVIDFAVSYLPLFVLLCNGRHRMASISTFTSDPVPALCNSKIFTFPILAYDMRLI